MLNCYLGFGFVLQEKYVGEDSLEWKLAQLFVVDADNISTSYILPAYVINKQLPIKKVDSKYPTQIIDCRNAGVDTLSIPYPSSLILNSINDKQFVDSFNVQFLNYCFKQSLSGTIIYDKDQITSMYLINDSLLNFSKLEIYTFPQDLLSLLSPRSELDYVITGPKTIFPAPYPEIGNMYSLENITLGMSFEELLQRDILFYTNNFESDHKKLVRIFKNKLIDESVLNKALEARKKRNRLECAKIVIEESGELLDQQKVLRYEAYMQSISIYTRDSTLKNKRIFYSKGCVRDFRKIKDAAFMERVKYYQPNLSLGHEILSDDGVTIMLCDSPDSLIAITEELRLTPRHDELYKILMVSGQSASFFNSSLMQSFDAILIAEKECYKPWDLMAQGLFGGFRVDGHAMHGHELEEQGFVRNCIQKTRLGFSFPEMAGISQDSISKVDQIVMDAIEEKATPGAQLLIAHNASIVYQKSYGFHSYANKQKVDDLDLYDVASLTKIAVTFPLVMELVEQDKLDLNAGLEEYITGIDTTDKKDIRIHELLLHESGLRSYIPFHKNAINKESLGDQPLYNRRYSNVYNIKLDNWLYQNKYARYRPDVFSRKPDSLHTVVLSTNMFMNESYKDSMLAHIYASELRIDKNYLYSDLGYHLLEKAIEPLLGNDIAHKFKETYSNSIGADRLLFNPLKSYPLKEIVPSENDLGFRKELLHGYVHDQSAAMHGGISAHAGLFANAGDLAKIAQLFLNRGHYGGSKYFEPKTIESFTQIQNTNNRRGLGVDKPEFNVGKQSPVSSLASPSSYGHTGFTGTILWIDPAYDLIYIFLSNRIHPRAYNKKLIELNVRTNIQEIIYNSIKTK